MKLAQIMTRPRYRFLASLLPPLTRIPPVEFGLSLLLLCAMWLGVGQFHAVDRRDEIERILADAARMSHAFEESIARRTDFIDNTLKLLRTAQVRGASSVDLGIWSRSNTSGPVFQVAFIGPDGRLVSSNLEPVSSRMDLSDRRHFRVHADDLDRDELFVSKPVIGRASGKVSLQFSRRVSDMDGNFAGVVVASLSPSVLTELHNAMGEARGTLFLLGTDGGVRARSPEATTATSFELDGHLASLAASSSGGMVVPQPGLGFRPLGWFRRVEGRPLAVAVVFDEREVMLPFEIRWRVQIAAAIAASFLVFLAAWMLGARNARLRRSREELVASRRALEAAIDGVSQGIIMFDPAGRVAVANRRAADVLGVSAQMLADKPHLQDLVLAQLGAGEFSESFADPDSFLTFAKSQWTETARDHVYERTRANGTILEVRTHTLPEGSYVRTYSDITERRTAEERARHFAQHDSLTGLPNRLLMTSRLEAAVSRGGCAVLFLDLDRFKLVNDLHGHQAGDRLLVAVSTRLRPVLRQGDTLARFGGDEFAILLASASADDAAKVARRVVTLLNEPFQDNGLTHLIGVSVGIALHPADGLTGAALLRAADTAMYCAKKNGKANFAFYNVAMGSAVDDQASLERDLGEALAGGQFTLVYQPVCNAMSSEVEGFEALIRWLHPVRGQVPPSVFIPAAERAGLIMPISAWVLEVACLEAASWARPLRIAVNLSPPQFTQPDLCEQVQDILHRTGLSPSRLDLEVTEGLMLVEGEAVLRNLTNLRKLGVKISLDDFGTGFSSLSYLCRFPFDTLKIDRSFIQNLGDDAESRAIVSSVLNLSRSLNLNVVAEGVETALQLQELQEMRCNRVQGYLLGRPMPSDEARALIGTGSGGEATASQEPSTAPFGAARSSLSRRLAA